jgi:hypothetical protein
MNRRNYLPRVLRAGSLAYLDTFAGLVPCKVLRVWRADDWPHMRADVQITATRGAYKRGALETFPAKDCPPRDAIRTRCGQFRIVPFTCIES